MRALGTVIVIYFALKQKDWKMPIGRSIFSPHGLAITSGPHWHN